MIHDYVEKFDVNDKVVYIVPDPDPFSPLENDNLGTMVCFHRRYELGHPHNYRSEDYGGWNEVREAIIKDHDVAVILPLFLFDHSGITLSTTADQFRACDSAGWDWGCVGFVYASKRAGSGELHGETDHQGGPETYHRGARRRGEGVRQLPRRRDLRVHHHREGR